MWNKDDIELTFTRLAVFLTPAAGYLPAGVNVTIGDAAFALALLVRLTAGGIPVHPLGRVSSVWFMGLLLLGFGILVSSIASGVPMNGVLITVQYYFCFLFVALVVMNRSYEVAVSLIRTAIWALSVMCIIGVAAYLMGVRGNNTEEFELVSGAGRVASLLDNPNALASYIALQMPLLWFAIHARAMNAFLAVGHLLLALVTLMLASSNSGIIALAIGLAVYLLALGRLTQIFYAAAGVALVIIAVVLWGDAFLSESFQRRVLSALMSGDASAAGTFNDRMALIHEAIGFAENNLVIGFGADQYRTISAHHLPVHNTYLLLLNEGGLIALVGLIIVLLTAAFVGLRANGIGPYGGTVCAGTLAVLAILAAVMVGFTHAYARWLVLPLLLFLGVAAALQSVRSTATIRVWQARAT